MGRDTELEQLRQALARARAGNGQVVAGVGEAGVGKSRLLYEFTRSHHTHGWLQLASHSVSYGKATAYLPVLDLLQGYFQIEPRDDVRRRHEKVTGKLRILDRALEPWLPALLAPLEVPVEDPQWQAFDPRNAAAAPSRPSSTCCCVKARSSRCAWCSRTCTGLMPRPRRCWTVWWRACTRPGCCCW